MAQSIFKRVETKYLLTKEQYTMVRNFLGAYMVEDGYGLTTICSIYYDTENYDLIRTSLEKPVYKEKLRLRAYGDVTEDSNVFLELKKKYKGTVYKRRIQLPLFAAEDYLEKGIYPSEYDSQILKEIDYFMKFYKPTRCTFVSYDRIAMYGRDNPEIRITFDTNIRTAFDCASLLNRVTGENILGKDEYLMEIKVPGAMPLWLAHILSDLKVYPVSFSKYGTACKRFLEYEGLIEVESEPTETVTVSENVPTYKKILAIKKFA